MKKIFRSIDNKFYRKNKFVNLHNPNQLLNKSSNSNNFFSIIGMSNSISAIPFGKNSTFLLPNQKKYIHLDKKKKILTASGNILVYEIHNYLLKNNFFTPHFPSYPGVTLSGCVANATHGVSSKYGILTDFITQITIYNPNFGFKNLSNSNNKEIFNMTLGGFGLTGIIYEAKIKVFKLKSTFLKTETLKFDDLYKCYSYINKNNNFINNNTFYISNNKIEGILTVGNFKKKNYLYKELKLKKISNIRLGVFNFKIFKYLFFKIFFFTSLLKKSEIHINDAIFPSNKRTIYFNLIGKKFIEHQNIIPKKNIKKYLMDLKTIINIHNPNILLCHMKIFNGKKKNFLFNDYGLSISIHVSINCNFKDFYQNLMLLDEKYNCRINFYKNSQLNFKILRNQNTNYYNKFLTKLKKINKKFKFVNHIFLKEIIK
jgi:decaprenylphospho-beta-D-ribofuranose 2-oxidase